MGKSGEKWRNKYHEFQKRRDAKRGVQKPAKPQPQKKVA